MLYEMMTRRLNVVELADVRQRRETKAMRRLCRYCGADLGDGEKEEDCSGAWFATEMPQAAVRRRFRAE